MRLSATILSGVTGTALQTLNDLEARLIQTAPYERDYVMLLAEEARFGLQVISARLEVLSAVHADARVLEIGAGCFMLSCAIASCGLCVTALEPVGGGFEKVRRIQDLVRSFANDQGIRFATSTDLIEIHRPDARYDFAFSINVYEHLEDPEASFASLNTVLNDGAHARIACPNYHVPYESHYRLPIFLNPRFTKSLFQRKIDAFDQENDCAGLWDSLNFITSSDVQRYAGKHSLKVVFDKGFIVEMFARMRDDPFIRARQGLVGHIARAAAAVGLPHLLKVMPMPLHPYMVFEISR